MEEEKRKYSIYVGYFVGIDVGIDDVEVSETQLRELLGYDGDKLAELHRCGFIALCEYDKDGDGYEYGVYLKSCKMA